MPHMIDPIFSKSVIYVCDHNKYGAMGLIINKKIENYDIHLLCKENSKLHSELYIGGPVSIEHGLILHHANYQHDDALAISSTIAITNKQKILGKIKNKKNIPFKLMLGHCGWAPNQLEKEIENGDWLMQNTTDDFIFNFPSKQMWKHATSSLGIGISTFIGSHGKT